ncbi:MAG: RNA methyltransferase [Bacteroidales bacterium]|nr:RNA methyltransferase [Bacteroidales bacterium]
MELISSAKNPKIKTLKELWSSSKFRLSERAFVVEGRRELQHALEGGFTPRTVFFCPDIPGAAELAQEAAPAEALVPISANVYESVAMRGSSEGLVAVMEMGRDRRLEDVVLPPAALILVAENIEKPGNIGALLRTADACRADLVILCDCPTDLYNPNIIRSSLGGIFTCPVLECSSARAIEWLAAKGVKILTAQLQDSSPYYDVDMTGPTAIVLGAEATGLTEAWRKASGAKILIPMLGRLDSLNVSISGAVLMYEAVRQRMSAKK